MSAERSYDLTERMAELGAEDPQGWAVSEEQEGIPQEARWLVLRHLWPRLIDCYAVENVNALPAAQRALGAGAKPEDLVQIMRAVAYEAAFGVLEVVDEGYDAEAPEDAPGWVLMETRGEGELTGRHVGGLHEDFLSADPSGREGSDLWD